MKNNIRRILINLNMGRIVKGVKLFDSPEGMMCQKFKYENDRLIETTFYNINNDSDMEKLDAFINQIEIKENNTNILDQFDDDGTTIDMIIEEMGSIISVESTLLCGIIDFYNAINEILKDASIIVKRAYSKAGINEEKYSVHTLRHTCATLLLKIC